MRGSDAAPPNSVPPLLAGTCTVSFKLIGVKRPLLSAASSRLLERLGLLRRQIGLMSSTPNVCLMYGGGLVGYGCVGQLCSPSISLFGTGRSSIGQIGSPSPDRTRRASRSSPSRDHITVPSVVTDRRQLRRRARIHVPEIVMDELKVPVALAAASVERDDRRAEEIRADGSAP